MDPSDKQDCMIFSESTSSSACTSLADQPAGIANRPNRASIGIFQQQSFLVGVSSPDQTDTHGLSEDLFAVDGSTRATKRVVHHEAGVSRDQSGPGERFI